jgi:hypothetical protein
MAATMVLWFSKVREGEGHGANAMIADHCVLNCGGWGKIDVYIIS